MAFPKESSGGGATSVGTGLQAGDGSGGLAAPTAATVGYSVFSVAPSNVAPQSATPSPSGMSVTLTAGAVYEFEIFAYVTTTSTGNTFALNGGTATATSVVGVFNTQNANTAISSLASSLTSTVTSNVSYRATGTITVNAGGTFAPTFASTAAALDTLLAGSWMRFTRIS